MNILKFIKKLLGLDTPVRVSEKSDNQSKKNDVKKTPRRRKPKPKQSLNSNEPPIKKPKRRKPKPTQ